MSPSLRRTLLALPLAGFVLLSGCGGLERMSDGIVGMVPTYKVGVVQGNFISKEQVEALQPGMSRQQVAELLGTPLLASVFHANRWDYAFTMKSQGSEPLSRRLTVFFNGELLERHEGDEMLTESEFAARVGVVSKARGSAPKLEASDDELKSAASAPKPSAAPTAAASPPTTTYPPLEPVTR